LIQKDHFSLIYRLFSEKVRIKHIHPRERPAIVHPFSRVPPPLLHPLIRWSKGGQRVEEGWTRGGETYLYIGVIPEYSMLYG